MEPYERVVNILKGYFKLHAQYTQYGDKDYKDLISQMIERDQTTRPNCEQVIKQLKIVDGDETEPKNVIVAKSYTGNEFYNHMKGEVGTSRTRRKQPPNIDVVSSHFTIDSKTSEFRKFSQKSSRLNGFVGVISDAAPSAGIINQQYSKCILQ